MLDLVLLEEHLAIVQLPLDTEVPAELFAAPFYAITRTADELSLVVPEGAMPAVAGAGKVERGWRCIKVQGPLDFSLTGVLAAIAGTLAAAKISLFALSTYDTDYILVKTATIDQARTALLEAGYRFV